MEISKICRPSSAIKQMSIMLMLAMASLILASCSATPESSTASNQATPPVAEKAVSPTLPEVDMTAELLQKLLTAELAYMRNLKDDSIELLINAADETRDPRLAELTSKRAITEERYDIADSATALWVELDPWSSEAWRSRGITQLAKNEKQGAVESFRQTLDVSGAERDDNLEKISQIVSSSLDPKGAYELYGKVVELYPGHVVGYLELFNMGVSAGLTEENLQMHIDEALLVDPASDSAAATKFAFFLEQKKSEEAKLYAMQQLEKYPDSHRLRSIYADFLSDSGLIRSAIEQFMQIPEPDALFSSAQLFLYTNRYQEAYEKLLQYVEVNPHDQLAYLGIARASLRLGKLDETQMWLRRVVSSRYIFQRSLVFARLEAQTKSLERGVEILQKIPTRSNPQRVQVYLAIDELYREADRMEDALKALDQGLSEFPNNTNLLLAHSYVAAELSLVDVVERDIQTLLNIQPNNAQALNSLGYTLADQTDRLEEARVLIEEALKIRPYDPYILDSMGWVHYRLGNYDEAIDFIKRAYEELDDPVMAAHLGEIFWVNGQRRQARKVWREARKRTPENKILLETIRKFTN